MSGKLSGLAILVLVFHSFVLQVGAQTGFIEGVITDKSTGETIPGANVVIDGTTTGSSSDLNGKFSFRAQAGTHNVKVMFISYETVVIEGVVVQAGRTTSLNVSLNEVSTEIEGVQVVARRITHTEGSMITTIRTANVVAAGITSQQIQRSQDSDAASVVKRIPGVTIVDDRFIFIRGLSERYNPAMLHNIFAPSMEADAKSFSFDVVPSSLIDRIMIYKSPSPELPGDFAGGVVKIYTRAFAERNFINITYSSGYDSNTSLRDFYVQETGKFRQLGINNKYNALPTGFPSSLRSIASDPERIQSVGRSLNNNWVPIAINAGLNHSLALTGGFSKHIGPVEIGNVTALTYSMSRSSEDIRRRDYNEYDMDLNRSSVIFDFNDNRNSEKIRTGLLHNWLFSFGPGHKVEFINIYNHLSQSEYTFRTGPMYEFDYNANNHSFYQIYRGIYSGQLTGRHEFGGGNTAIDWTAGISRSTREEPDYRRFRSELDTVTGEIELYIPQGAAATYFMGRFYSEMRENVTAGSADLTQKFMHSRFGRFAPEIKAGIFYDHRDRSFDGRNLGYVRANAAEFDQSLKYVTIDVLFSPENINPVTGIKIDEQTNPSDSYTAQNTILAGYAMMKMPLFSGRVSITAGVRVEDNIMKMTSRTLTNEPVNVDNNDITVLPSFNLAYNFTERSLVRLALGRTINRSEFRELAPFGFYDFNYNLVRKGNPDLTNASVWNIDTRWEFYPGQGEMITAGLFYKNFTDAIELTFLPGGGTAGIKTFIPVNASQATSMGGEVEVRKSLESLFQDGFLGRFAVLFNGAIIYSRIQPEDKGTGFIFQERPMQGQSPYIVNAGLYYRDAGKGLQMNLLYNIIGRRIMIIGYDEYPDIYEMPRHLAEFTITKSLGRGIELKAGVKDIFNQETLLLQDSNRDGVFDRKTDQVIERYYPGTLFTLGLSIRFQQGS